MANEFRPRKKGKVIEDAVTMVLPDGRVFEGWENLSITKSLEQLTDTFSFEFDNRFSLSNEKWPIAPGDLIRVNVDGLRVITGRIDTLNANFSSSSRTISVSGRSLSADLVDCSVTPSYEIEKQTPLQIAERLASLYGLRVFTSVEAKTIDKFSLKPGESVFTALDRAARLQGFFWVTTPNGNIRLTKISRARAFSTLEQDVNMLSGSISFNEAERFRDYTVIGNRSGTEDYSGENASQPSGFSQDLGVDRFRPMILIAEASVDSEQAQDRAEWEASVRVAKGLSVTAAVQGWRQANGILWGVNQLTKVKSPFLGINLDLLIASVTFSKSNSSGTTCQIQLRREDAYQPEPMIPKEKDPKTLLGRVKDAV